MLYYNNVLSVSSPSKLEGDKGGSMSIYRHWSLDGLFRKFFILPPTPSILEGELFA